MTKSRKIIIYFSLILFGSLAAQQMPNNKSAKGLIRQYGFSAFSVADAYSDSIRVLSYLSVPNHVLQFIKGDNGFEAKYEATLSIKEKKGSQFGRKNWSNTLQTNDYIESTSRKIFTIHFAEFKVPPGNYIISAELLDRDSNDSGVRNKELKFSKHEDNVSLYTPFFLDYLSGRWGLEDNEIPLFQSFSGEKLTRTSVFISGKVQEGPYNLEVTVLNAKKKELWKKSFQAKASKKYFHQRIIIPEEVANQGLRKRVDVILSQGGVKKKESVMLSVTRQGISRSIGDITQAIQNMRYILQDDEWKKISKSKNEDQETLFLEYWDSKDPTPDTPDNELMDEYFSRVNYSNANFKGYRQGWKTDMGMVYILFGPPDDLEIYNDPLSRMYSQRWHYYTINKYFDFIDEQGFGDYRLTTPFFRGQNW